MEQLSIFDFLNVPVSTKPTNTVVLPQEIHIISVEAYCYTRLSDMRPMYAFLCECDNGMLYKKDFYTYHHMVENSIKNKNSFYKMLEVAKKENDVSKIEDYKPAIFEMHKCRDDVDWSYAEARYSGCIDSNYFLRTA